MSAFIVAIVAGLAADVAAGSILRRAILALVICYPLGFLVGLVCEHVIRADQAEFEADHPIPEVVEDLDVATEVTEDGAEEPAPGDQARAA